MEELAGVLETLRHAVLELLHGGEEPAAAETSFVSGTAERTISGVGRPFCAANEE